MGSQPRRSRDRPSSRRGEGRGGTGGPGSGDERRRAEEAKQRERIYRKARKALVKGLKTKNFSYVADVATSVTVSRVPVQDVISLFIAGGRAFNEGKDRDWEPDPVELASKGISYAQEKMDYVLSLERKQLFSNILANNLRKVGEKSRRK